MRQYHTPFTVPFFACRLHYAGHYEANRGTHFANAVRWVPNIEFLPAGSVNATKGQACFLEVVLTTGGINNLEIKCAFIHFSVSQCPLDSGIQALRLQRLPRIHVGDFNTEPQPLTAKHAS